MTTSAGDEVSPGGRQPWWRAWAPIIAVTALAATLRILALGEVPPGLYHDEAFNGLDAVRVLQGHRPIYFAANRGREPLFVYLTAAAVGLLGRTPGALRLAAALCGTLTIPATYLMVRSWFSRRIALLSAAITATTLWHIHLSRVGFRAVTLPLVTALALGFGARAFSSNRRGDWLLTGLVYGLSLYTYVPARFTPVVLGAFGIYLLAVGYGGRLWPGAAYFVAGAVIVLAPLIAYTAGHWEVVMGRPGQVSVFNPLINAGDLWGTLGRQLLRTLGMFFVRGDTIPRHNLPGRPVFTPLMGAAMVLGVIQAAIRARRRHAGSALALTWVGLMLLPTWLAEDAPHFLRAVGILPLLAVLPALGLDAARSWLEPRTGPGWAAVLPCTILAISLGLTGWHYFVRYADDPRTAYAFEDAATQLAAEANRFTGVGWDGSGLRASGGSGPRTERQAYIDDRLWQEWAAIPFLVPDTRAVVKCSSEVPPAPTGEALLLVWPHDGVKPYVRALPANARIEARAGPLTQGDLEDAPYTAYAAYVVQTDAESPAGQLARFGDRIALAAYLVEQDDLRWHVELEWEVLEAPEEDYTVFVYLYDGERLVDQQDGQPGDGYYPTSLWRKGDIVVDARVLELSEEVAEPRLVVGMYVWPAMERLEVTDPSGESIGDQLVLPVAPSGP